jgi:hypothetical protein
MSPSINHSVLQKLKTGAVLNEIQKLKLSYMSGCERYR